jgi:hypothetical protein
MSGYAEKVDCEMCGANKYGFVPAGDSRKWKRPDSMVYDMAKGERRCTQCQQVWKIATASEVLDRIFGDPQP